jgi:hypothetical protein
MCDKLLDANGYPCTSFPCCTQENSQGFCVSWHSPNVTYDASNRTSIADKRSCNQVNLPQTPGKSDSTTITAELTANKEWLSSIYYADSSNDDMCKDLDEEACKSNSFCGYDPTSSKSLCGNSCCGVANTAGKGEHVLQNNGIGQWTQIENLSLDRDEWAPSCGYLARNTLYNYNYTGCYTQGTDIRLKQYFQASQSTQNMCMDENGIECSKICNCKEKFQCNNSDCELMNIAIMGTSDQNKLKSMGLTKLLHDVQPELATDGAYIAALLAVVSVL